MDGRDLYERHFVPPPGVYLDPPPMDLGRFDISKGPSNRGGLDLGLFEESNRPSNEVEFSSKSPIHRLKPLIFAHSLRSVEGISLVQTQYWCPRDVGRRFLVVYAA